MNDMTNLPPTSPRASQQRPRELVVELPALLAIGSTRWRIERARLYADRLAHRYRAVAELVALAQGVEPYDAPPFRLELTGNGGSVAEAVANLAHELESSPLLEAIR